MDKNEFKKGDAVKVIESGEFEGDIGHVLSFVEEEGKYAVKFGKGKFGILLFSAEQIKINENS